VTAVSSNVTVTVSVAAATVVIAVPPAMVIVSPSTIVCVPESPANVKLLNGNVFVIVTVSAAEETDVIPVP